MKCKYCRAELSAERSSLDPLGFCSLECWWDQCEFDVAEADIEASAIALKFARKKRTRLREQVRNGKSIR